MIRLYFLSIFSIQNQYENFLPLLSLERQRKAALYHIENDKLRCIAGGILIRYILGSDEIYYRNNGKPYIIGAPEFNLSHDGEWSVLAVSDSAVGVDIEHCTQRCSGELSKLINSRIFSPNERECFNFGSNSNDLFYLLWTLKESFFKATGTGITSNSCIFSSDLSFFSCKPFNKYRISICTKYSDEVFEAFLVNLDGYTIPTLSPIALDFTKIK